jgi:hypothetical protein
VPVLKDPPEAARSDRRLAALAATVLALPVALLAGLGVFAYLGGFSHGPRPPARGTVTVTAPPSSAAADPVCARLLNALPPKLDGHAARPVSDAPNRVAAWGDPPIVLRCGVPRPASAGAAAQEFVINGIPWTYARNGTTAIWTTNKLPAYIEVRIPPEYQDSAAQRIINPLADPIAAAVR